MQIEKIKALPAVSPTENMPLNEKKTESKKIHAMNFSQLLQNIQQRELAEKIASETKYAKNPAALSPNTSGMKLNGDYISSLVSANPTEGDKHAVPQGNAAGSLSARGKTIDKTSKLYEQALELESYFVKIMLNTMKSTLKGSVFGTESYASKMYRDMMFDELSRTVTKNAGFGIADQIYLQLYRKPIPPER